MADSSDLELSLHRREGSTYEAVFRYNKPRSEAEVLLGKDPPLLASFDVDKLNAQISDPQAYGQALAASLFAHANVKDAFKEARKDAESTGIPLRLRLLVGATAPELNRLAWEALCDPDSGEPLFTSDELVFSRYLGSLDLRPVRLRPKGELRAVVAVAAPSDLPEYDLQPVDIEATLSTARRGLGKIPTQFLPAADKPQLTLQALEEALRDKPDILYLACHGRFDGTETWLYFTDGTGVAAPVAGSDLANRLKRLSERPRLVVLASCQSAGDVTKQPAFGDAENFHNALGPRLAEAGIPAVLAMQTSVYMDTIDLFMPAFFRELRRDGQVDRAMAAARSQVFDQGQTDWWTPVLFMRLKTGAFWYEPGFGKEEDFEKWPALVRNIQGGRCTAILGAGMYEPVLGTPEEIAQRWAEAFHYPLAPHERESLPQVAQYLSVHQQRSMPYEELTRSVRDGICQRFATQLPGEALSDEDSLDQWIEAVGKHLRAQDPDEPHKILASLPLKIYLTTNPDSMLVDALTEAGRKPLVMVCPWYRQASKRVSSAGQETIAQQEADMLAKGVHFDWPVDYVPSQEQPLVYYLFGRLGLPASLVLTEDDYFDFLIGVSRTQDLIPVKVRRALTQSSLLMLGFQMDDWNFRALIRTILSGEGGALLSDYVHISAQIQPEEGRMLQPARARRYLEEYFSRKSVFFEFLGADISIFWGSVGDFVGELQRKWQAASG